jgi:hypothetical protein
MSPILWATEMSSSISNTRIFLPPSDLSQCEGRMLNEELTLVAHGDAFNALTLIQVSGDLAG